MANILVKPISERDGNLVILADDTKEIFLIDLTTGEVIEQGVNHGASNGRDSTVRFSRPGAVYQNVGVMDDKGNVLLTMPNAGDRVQFNYTDYNALVDKPVSTIEGYRWDNSRNVQSVSSGGYSNADIAGMTPEEYDRYLMEQMDTSSAGTVDAPGSASQLAALATPIALGFGMNELMSGGGAEVASLLPGAGEGAMAGLDAAAPSIMGQVGQVAGTVGGYAAPVAGALALGKGVKDLFEGDEGTDSVEGLAGRGQLAISTGGLSEVGRLLGIGDRKTTKDYQRERTNELLEGVSDENLREDILGLRSPTAPVRPEHEAEYQNENSPLHYWGSQGVLSTFGAEHWLRDLTEQQRYDITQGLINADLFDDSKGDKVIRDENKDAAMAIHDAVVNNTAPTMQAIERPIMSRSMVESEGDSPVTDLEVSDGMDAYMAQQAEAQAAAEEAQKRSIAANMLMNSPANQMASGLLNQAFNRREKKDPSYNFEQLAGAFR